ncbi:unnamed protein product [Blepharisma stoltei]|uniref:PH domain-containing protein n=1 Tax=Blepharisma stoltei TaxID=1481888 RepID=A0AAU9J5S1_9CILI|nr:unnamed protein product [Blepharisma stoltei]
MDKNEFQSLAHSESCILNTDSSIEGYVLKLSKRKWRWNKRYLVLKHGFISYYNKKPRDLIYFDSSNKEISIPKEYEKIQNCDVSKVNDDFCKKKNKPFVFQICFFKNGKEIIWIFAVSSDLSLRTWLKCLNNAKEYEKKINPGEKLAKSYKESVSSESVSNIFECNIDLDSDSSVQQQNNIVEICQPEDNSDEIIIEISQVQEEIIAEKEEDSLELQKSEENIKLESEIDYQYQTLWIKSIFIEESYREIFIPFIDYFEKLGRKVAKFIVEEITNEKQIKPLEYFSIPIYIVNKIVCFVANSEDTCKILKNEYKACNKVTNYISKLIPKNENFDIRCPITCLVDYKGYRVFLIASPPLYNEECLLYGRSADGTFYSSSYVNDQVNLLLTELGLSGDFDKNSATFQVHQCSGYENYENYLAINRKEIQKDPPGELIYIINLHKLLSNCYDKTQKSRKINKKILKLINDFDKLRLMPIDSHSLENILHEKAIKLNCLGKIAIGTKMPHIRELCIIEILGRTIKNLFRKEIRKNYFMTPEETLDTETYDYAIKWIKSQSSDDYSDLLKEIDIEHYQIFENFMIPSWDIIETNSIPMIFNKGKATRTDRITLLLLNYLNLIFGNNEECTDFWNDTICEYAKHHFDIDSEYLQKKNLNLKMLYGHTLNHCGVKMKLSSYQKLDSNCVIFTVDDFIQFTKKSKIYDFKSLKRKYQAEFDYDPKIENFTFKELSIYIKHFHSIDICIKHFETKSSSIKNFEVNRIRYLGVLLIAYFYASEKEKMMECYERCKELISFNFNKYHPLGFFIDEIMADIYIESQHYENAILLLNSTLQISTISLGSNHAYVGKIYVKLGFLFDKLSSIKESINSFQTAYSIFSLACEDDEAYTRIALLLAKLLFKRESIDDANRIFFQSSDRLSNEKLNTEIISSLYELI